MIKNISKRTFRLNISLRKPEESVPIPVICREIIIRPPNAISEKRIIETIPIVLR